MLFVCYVVAEFGEDGRPFHHLFYTTRPRYYGLMFVSCNPLCGHFHSIKIALTYQVKITKYRLFVWCDVCEHVLLFRHCSKPVSTSTSCGSLKSAASNSEFRRQKTTACKHAATACLRKYLQCNFCNVKTVQ